MSDKLLQAYIASANSPDNTGIYYVDIDTESGEMQPTGGTQAIHSCLFTTRHPTLPVLYAVGYFDGEGHIYAFRIEADHSLSLINRQPTHGGEPCYISITQGASYALTVNYDGAPAGSVLTFPLDADGTLSPQAERITHEGSGPHSTRQEASHPHIITPTPDGRYVLVADLGIDKIMIYTLDQNTGKLSPHTQPYIEIQAGAGPRHLAFHPSEMIFYIMNELQPIITVVRYDQSGHFEVVANYPALPPDATPPVHQGADIHLSPSGHHLYATNRGHNSVVSYKIDESGEKLTEMRHQSTLGDWPRSFTLTPSGHMLIVTNRRTSDLHSFHVDQSTGELQPTGHSLSLPEPIGVYILPRG